MGPAVQFQIKVYNSPNSNYESATGINDTSGKFATGVDDTGGK
jgi:hypothetical protein